MWRWLDGIKKPEEQKKEAAEQKRKAGDNENQGGETKKISTFNMKWRYKKELLTDMHCESFHNWTIYCGPVFVADGEPLNM